MQNTKYKIQDTKYKIQNTKYRKYTSVYMSRRQGKATHTGADRQRAADDKKGSNFTRGLAICILLHQIQQQNPEANYGWSKQLIARKSTLK